MMHSSKCIVCKIKENNEHLFITCTTIQPMWNLINERLGNVDLVSNVINLEYSVLRYKVKYNMYKDLNIILTLINFAICKG